MLAVHCCDSHLHCVHQCLPFVRLLRRGVASAGSLRRGDAPAAERSAALHALPALLRSIPLSPQPPRNAPPLHLSTAPHPHTDNAASCRLPTHVIVMLRLPRSLRTHDTVLAPARSVSSEHHAACTPAPSEQQYTPRCPSVVLWTPCSGVEWRVSDPALKGKRHDEQAACEPGGGGRGGVPVHPARLQTHRTSLAQCVLTILMRHAATFELLSHCHLVCTVSDVH